MIEVKRLLTYIATGKAHGATITDMVQAARLVEAPLRSDREQRWISV